MPSMFSGGPWLRFNKLCSENCKTETAKWRIVYGMSSSYRYLCHFKYVGKLCLSWAQDISCIMKQRICRRSIKTKFSLSALSFQLFWALFRDYSELLVLSINRWPAKLLDRAKKNVFPRCHFNQLWIATVSWKWCRDLMQTKYSMQCYRCIDPTARQSSVHRLTKIFSTR